jgi:DNA-binding transcriptional ArsR family regulator
MPGSAALDRTLTALADPTRRAVVDLLRERPRRAGELAEALGASRPALSRHLRLLRENGLVEGHAPPEDARARVLQLRPGPLAELRGWLEELERFWAGQLQSFQAHVQAAGPGPASRRRRRR